MADPARQRLVHIDPAAWSQIIAGYDDPLIRDWAARGWPVIVRRPSCSDSGSFVPVGLPLPPSHGKARIPLSVPRETITTITPPPLLRQAAAAAPPDWQVTIAALLIMLPELRCFGGLAWQYLTGLPYLSATSDLDLYAECADRRTADETAAALQAVAPSACPAIDGELARGDGAGVQWREWASEAALVMVKADDARLCPRDEVFA